MPISDNTEPELWSAEELLRHVIDVYAHALDALETQETERLGDLLSKRRALLGHVKHRDAQGWPGIDQLLIEPLIERVKNAEKKFITRLDEHVSSMRNQMVESNKQRRGVAAYQRQSTGAY